MSDQRDTRNPCSVPGTAEGVRMSGSNYAENLKYSGPRGHGLAAEQANHLYDRSHLRDAKVVGGDNAKNGPDRLVDGTWIQSKYCRTGAACIRECFGEDGLFRYLKPDGTPMAIEVPLDHYDAAVQALQERIRKGKVPGVTDPLEAQRIVRKGHFTYAQARRIAQAGTIEGLTFDAVRGVEIAGRAAGMSALLTFAVSVWRGDDPKVALQAGALSGLQTGGVAWISSIGAAQLGRTRLEGSLRPATDALVRKLGPKLTRAVVRGTGRNLSGAAASSHLSKLMRGNAVTGVVTVAAMSAGDVVNLFRRRISAAQLIKNLTVTTAGVAGGTGGMMAGAAIGTAFLPGPGTILGGIVGSLMGGTGAQAATKAAMDVLIQDDAKRLLTILEEVLAAEVEIALLSESECEAVIAALQKDNLPKRLKEIHAARDHTAAARDLILPLIDVQLARRPRLAFPDDAAFLDAADDLLGEVA